MILLAAAAKKRFVRGILYERLLECILRLGGRSGAIEKLRLDQPVERLAEHGVIHAGDDLQKRIAELPSDRRAELGDILDGGQAIQAVHQRVVESRRYGQRGERTDKLVATVRLAKKGRFDHKLEDTVLMLLRAPHLHKVSSRRDHRTSP